MNRVERLLHLLSGGVLLCLLRFDWPLGSLSTPALTIPIMLGKAQALATQKGCLTWYPGFLPGLHFWTSTVTFGDFLWIIFLCKAWRYININKYRAACIFQTDATAFASLGVSCLSIKYTEQGVMGNDTNAALQGLLCSSQSGTLCCCPTTSTHASKGCRKSPCVATNHLNKELVLGLWSLQPKEISLLCMY